MPKTSFTLAQLAPLFAAALVLSACSKKPEEQATAATTTAAATAVAVADAPVVFAAQAPIAVTLNLLQADGKSGRQSPIHNNYRPQVRFPLAAEEPTCTVQLPAESPSLEPGQSSAATLSCDAEIKVERSQPSFAMFEGGKQVGLGTVTLR